MSDSSEKDDKKPAEALQETILSRFREGGTWTWTAEGQAGSILVRLDSAAAPPCYRVEGKGGIGWLPESLDSDQALLQFMFDWTCRADEKMGDAPPWERILSAMDARAVLPAPSVNAPAPPLDFSRVFGSHADVYPSLRGAIRTQEEARRAASALKALYRVSLGYSDRHLDMQGMIPAVFGVAQRLIRDLDDILSLCKAMPDILRSLPEESESTPIGWCHSYDLEDLRARTEASETMEEFISAGREGSP